jgi:hypothetical protein
MPFAAVHESASGTKQTYRDACIIVRFWGGDHWRTLVWPLRDTAKQKRLDDSNRTFLSSQTR